MTNCNHCTKSKKLRGRRREWVSYEDFVKPPTETMLILANMKNDSHSWRSLADELNHGKTSGLVGPSLVRRVTLGLCNSSRIDYVLGIRSTPPPVEVEPCPDCGQVHKQRKACKPSRKTGKHSFVILLDDDDFYEARAAVAGYPGGRPAWLMEHVRGAEPARG